MTKPLLRSRRFGTLLLILPIGLIPLMVRTAQNRPSTQYGVEAAPVHGFHDWTTRHVVYPHAGLLGRLNAVESDPRAQFAWREWTQQHTLRSTSSWGGRHLPFLPLRRARSLSRDWSVSLGGGTTAAGQFPAEFTSTPGTPDCTNDFVVFPIDVNGSGTQANIVALNNLYRGTGGLCGTGNPTFLWSYNVHAISSGAAVLTSPELSLDGNKIAFIESASGHAAHFHVLAWKSGDGTSVTAPKAITTFVATAPAALSGTATDLQLGASTTATDTVSSPFVDYVRDQAYVGNDIGVLYRINNVFCTTAGCNNAAPSLDTSWGTSGAVSVPCASKLTGPDMDFVTLNVYVGCSDGKVYGFTSTGRPLSPASISVGNGSATGGVVDTPIVDGVDGLIYAVSGTGAAPHTGNAVVVQATTSLGGLCAGGALCVATVGNAGAHPAHSPDFNNSFYSGSSPSSWLLYMGGFTGAGTQLTLYGITFNSSTKAMTAGTPGNTLYLGGNLGEYSPLTEFMNGTTDWLFLGVLYHATGGNANIGSLVITSFPTRLSATVAEGSGPSGIVVDNNSTQGQASNIYLGAQGCGANCGNTAVKLTQSGLN